VVAICPDSLFRVSPTNLLGADLSLKLEIRRPKAHLEAIVNGYHHYPLIDVSRFVIAEAYSSAIVPGVIIPCSFIVLTKVMMFSLCVCVFCEFLGVFDACFVPIYMCVVVSIVVLTPTSNPLPQSFYVQFPKPIPSVNYE